MAGNSPYPYTRTRQTEGGALVYAFGAKWGLPLFMVQGPGIVPGKPMAGKVVGPQQVYVVHDTIAAGLQGVQAGQIMLTHLLDTRFVEGAPVPGG